MSVVHTIDLNYLGIPRAIAAYLVMGPRGPVLIESGPASTLDQLAAGLAKHGLKFSDIHHVLVTHIHLDHAGAAGHLARHGAHIYVQEFGIKHLLDPSKLIDSATRIYGDQMDRLWGKIIPIPANQLTAVHDGDVIEVAGLQFEAIETPGHARHHHSFALGGDDICFTGDIAGITVPGVAEPPKGKFVALPTPPPEFDREAWLASLARLQTRNFKLIYPTHFGERHNPAAHLHRVGELVNEHAEFVQRQLDSGKSRAQILAAYIAWQQRESAADGVSQRDFARYVSTNLLAMNVDGMIRYWTKQKEHAAS